ncbi:hypothetical protein BD769DRAFT_738131 [Suillus cothurnatus]|nr:hypothetical protein BD769DRAFT_738131 [Suillus cothurnatus]
MQAVLHHEPHLHHPLLHGLYDGSNYDVDIQNAQFSGPPAALHRNPDSLDNCLVGLVELARRRVTSYGRVRLKLLLLGVNVQKCTIGDHGVLGAKCHHAFYQRCLIPWLARIQTCPLCREHLDRTESFRFQRPIMSNPPPPSRNFAGFILVSHAALQLTLPMNCNCSQRPIDIRLASFSLLITKRIECHIFRFIIMHSPYV